MPRAEAEKIAGRKTATPRPRELAPVPPAPPGVVPPQNLEAEAYLLGAAMISPGAIDACRDLVEPGDFYYESNARIWRAVLALRDAHEPVDAITMTDWLEERGELAHAGGRVRLHELAAIVPATANASHYARIVREMAVLRALIRAGGEVARLGWDRPGDVDELVDRARLLVEHAAARAPAMAIRERLVPGGTFILDEPAGAVGLWGDGDDILWSQGEGLMICGPQGVGKTTLAQQLVLARLGVRDPMLLGLPVADDGGRVLYLAADRPAQAQRSLARMVKPEDRATLDERLVVHRGPLDVLVDGDPHVLERLAERASCTALVVDSLKDIAGRLTDDETGGRINLAFQYAIAAGVDVAALHHQRKASENNRKPTKLDDVYGSNRITSGLGSVLLLWGDAGDLLVEMSHLKQPAEPVGPWELLHDHAKGVTVVSKRVELVELLYRASTEGLTAQRAAELFYVKESPNRNELERVRRNLGRLVDAGRAVKLGAGGNDSPRFVYDGGLRDRP